MQQIVVDAEADAKAAIGFLKRTGGGRATFLPLSAMTPRSLQESGVDSCRGFVGVASRLVRCEDRYRGVVENLLGRTVIVEELDSAIAMARQYRSRFKIVTLDGQVMNPGGSMTGGSVAKEAGFLSRANELKRLSAQEIALQAQKTTTETALAEAQRAVEQTEFELTATREQLRAAEDEVLRLEGEEKQHHVLLQALGDAAASAGREMETLRTRHQADRERAASLRGQLETLRYQLTDAESTLESLSQDQSDAARQTEILTGRMAANKTDMAALEAERRSATENVERLESLCASLEGDRAQKLAILEATEADTARIQEDLDRVSRDRAANQEKTGEARQALQQALDARAQTEAGKPGPSGRPRTKINPFSPWSGPVPSWSKKSNHRPGRAAGHRPAVGHLWPHPSTAAQERAELESVPAGNRRIGELKRKIAALGTPNLGAIEEYARVNERYSYLTAQRDDVLTAKRELESIIRNITTEMTSIFVTEFQKIDQYFQQTFTEMFGGGKGALVLEDPDNPLTCGIEIRVQPPASS